MEAKAGDIIFIVADKNKVVFDEEFLKKIGGTDYQRYSDAYDAYMKSFEQIENVENEEAQEMKL